jgi:cytosine permease
MKAWWNFTYLFLGMSICLSNFMIGQELVKEYGIFYSIGAIVIGNLLLLLLAFVKAHMGFSLKATTMEVAQRYFGKHGSVLLSLIFSLAIVGWFGIELNLTATSAHKALALLLQRSDIPLMGFILGLTLLITSIVAQYGIIGIEKLSRYFLPLFMLVLGVVIMNAWHLPTPTNLIAKQGSWHGISVIFATAIAAVIDMPVFFRLARSYKDACISSILFLLAIIPSMQLIGVYTAFKRPTDSFVDVLTASDTAPLQLGIVIFLIIAGWVSNSSNVYSGAFAIEPLSPSLGYRTRVWIIGVIGMICAYLITYTKFESIINGMGIVISSMGAIIAVNYLFEIYYKAFSISSITNILLLIASSAIGFCSFAELITVTGSPVLDAFITATCFTAFSKAADRLKSQGLVKQLEGIK